MAKSSINVLKKHIMKTATNNIDEHNTHWSIRPTHFARLSLVKSYFYLPSLIFSSPTVTIFERIQSLKANGITCEF